MKYAHKGIIEASTDGKTRDPRELAKLEVVKSEIYQSLQKIGPFLSSAEPRLCDLTMKAAELKTLQGLNVEDRGTGAENLPQIELQTDEHAYALHFIPVPIRVKTTPNTTIYFEATAGGRFKAVSEHTTGDGLSLAKVVTDKDGIAEIAWFTPGDSVGYNEVFISTPKASNFKIVSIETKQLLPKPIVDILSVNKRVPHKLPNKKPQLPKHN